MQDIIPQRTCVQCGNVFPVTKDYWYSCSRSKDGFIRTCKICEGKRKRKWETENKDKNNARRREYRQRDYVMEQARDYRKRTNDHRREYNRQYRAEHPEWVREVCKRFYRNHREKRLAEGRIRACEWKRANPDKVRNHNHMRRAMKLGNGGEGFTKADKELQLRSQKGLCWWCGEEMGADITIDHIVAINRGGPHSPRNIVLAHKKCNCSKKDRLPHEWAGRLF